MSIKYLEHQSDGTPKIVKYSIVKRRGLKNLTMRLGSDNTLKVTAPYRCSQDFILEFIRSNLDKVISRINPTQSILDRRRSYLNHKKEALELVTNIIKEFKDDYGDVVNKIRIKDTKSLWGSCSSANNLNFNYKIVFLPLHLQRYIVAHELCHLKELNHSQRFWDLVSELDKEYRVHDLELRNFRASEMR